MLSVVCPIYNEEKYIAACIDSILAQDYPKDDLEVIFADGMSTDRTREILASYIVKYPWIKLIDNPDKIVPYAMNLGIEKSVGDIIIRLDAHVVYPSNYFSLLVAKLIETGADNVGCVCETLPTNDSTQAIAIAETLSSPFGVGNSMFRIGTERDIETDTVPFGCFRREVFDKIGLYDPDLVRNQDDELNARIINSGGKIVLLSGLRVKYYARNSLCKLYKMYYQYGLYKPLVNKKLGKPATSRQLVPPMFVCGLVVGAILGFLSPWLWIIYAMVLLAYMLVGMGIGVKAAKRRRRPSLIFVMPVAMFIVHFAYGFGYLNGIYKILFKRSFNVKVNR